MKQPDGSSQIPLLSQKRIEEGKTGHCLTCGKSYRNLDLDRSAQSSLRCRHGTITYTAIEENTRIKTKISEPPPTASGYRDGKTGNPSSLSVAA